MSDATLQSWQQSVSVSVTSPLRRYSNETHLFALSPECHKAFIDAGSRTDAKRLFRKLAFKCFFNAVL